MIQIQVVSIPQFTQKMKRHFSRESTSLNITAERMEPRGIKVHIFWEGHKILRNLPFTFDWMYCSQKKGKDFAKFRGLVRIYELYRRTEKKTRKCVEWLTCTVEANYWCSNLHFDYGHIYAENCVAHAYKSIVKTEQILEFRVWWNRLHIWKLW